MSVEPNFDSVERPCPRCGKINDVLSGVNGPTVAPVYGDLTVCIRCGLVEMISERGEIRSMTRTEFAALPKDTQAEIARIVCAITMLRRAQN